MHITTFVTPHGWMAAAWSKAGLQGLSLPQQSQEEARRALAGELNKCLSNLPFPTQPRTAEEALLEEEILRYFAKERVHFSTSIDFSGYTAFQKLVLELVRAIPYGETRTYGEVALQADRPKGARAIGGVMRINRTPIIIPCHRILAAGGGLGGYSGGLEVKRRLLQLEGSLPEKQLSPAPDNHGCR
ncbi:MAG: methylated-DNA--[protein]-cysteine S-methyltransferase [Peptococcaceae bacterium]|jgi:methylated-DNA-[protein]-cysteine S-methyltransferase|nr:methylated-DNA--[protein]-cysteine S-methyltransferase [Peptococcaceae bacterium]